MIVLDVLTILSLVVTIVAETTGHHQAAFFGLIGVVGLMALAFGWERRR